MATDQDVPSSFYDMSWVAIRNADLDAMMQALALSDPIPVTWVQGVHALGRDMWNFREPSAEWSRVYITPQFDGWRLGLGAWFSGLGERGRNEVAEGCRVLSSAYGRACAFTTQGRMAHYAWILCTDGCLERFYDWDGGLVCDQGAASAREIALIEARKAEWFAQFGVTKYYPNEEMVMGLAAAFSLDIDTLGPSTKVEGQGFLCNTPIGRERTGPPLPVCNCTDMRGRCG